MVDDLNKGNIKGLENWEPGDPITAEKLDQPVRVLQGLGGVKPADTVVKSGSKFQIRMFKVVRLETDVVICNTFDGVESGEDEIKVALPYLLRKTPFDAATRTEEPRAGITYVYSDNHLRLATNEDEDEENQIIVDSYEEGDIIFAMRGIFSNTGLYADDPTNEIPIVWIDNNNDGRYWAQDDDPPEAAS
jgi:hypothetical protein